MPDQIHKTAMKWASAIQTRLPENVLRLYHPDGSLWGTLSPVVRHGHEAIYEYFLKFLQREDLMCEFKEGSVRVHDNFAFYTGHYEFTWKVKRRVVRVPARFSFVYIKEGKQWLIMEHHSSLFPELPLRIRKYVVK